MSKHTPGPWRIGIPSWSGGTGEPYRNVRAGLPGKSIKIATAHGEDCDANAALIAAAPDLLSALEEAARVLTLDTPDPGRRYAAYSALVPLVFSAIAKAKEQIK